MSIQPPVVARWILRSLLPRELREPVEGDLAEGFLVRLQSGGRFAAWRWYWGEVLGIPCGSLRRRAARLEAGRGHRRRSITWKGGGDMMRWTRELRIAIRSLMRRPAFALTGIVTLALSLGAATLLFSVTEGVLLRPLPFPESDRVVNLYLENEEWRTSENALFRSIWDSHHVSADHLEAWRGALVGLESIGSYALLREPIVRGDQTLDGGYGLLVDEGFFETVGLDPLIGRLPGSAEFAAGAPVAVISTGVWRDLYGGDPAVEGSTFAFGDRIFTVVGVLPAEFPFPDNARWSFWTPLTSDTEHYIRQGIGRLEAGASVAAVSERLDEIAARLGEDDPDLTRFGARAMLLLDDIVSGIRTQLLFLFLTTLVVLAVACVNLANLILVRGAARRSELAVRTALGASRPALFGSVFSEVIVVCALGGGLGVLLATLAFDPFVSAFAATVGGLPREGEVSLNATVMVFAAGATLTTALLAGLVPALRGARRLPGMVLAEGHRGSGAGRSGRRAQRALLLAQSGLTAVLLVGTGLLLRSAVRAAVIDPGYDAAGVAHVSVRLERGEGVDPVVRSAALERTQARLAGLPGVTSVAMASTLPVVGGAMVIDMRSSSQSESPTHSLVSTNVSVEYFETLDISVQSGTIPARTPASDAPEQVALSESAARALFGEADPVGRRVHYGEDDVAEVVAVVGDSRFWILREPFTQVYRFGGLERFGFVSFAVHTTGDPLGVVGRGREIAGEELSDGEVVETGSLSAALAESTSHLRARAVLMLALGFLAALLTVVGIAGVVRHFLAEQTREVAVRMALGAPAMGESRRIVASILGPALAGLALGLLAATWLSRLTEGVLFEISARDPATYVGAALFVLVLAGLAAWIPARRTTRIAPAEVLNGG